MNPRLVVTESNADDLLFTLDVDGVTTFTMYLPERPTMPCPEQCSPPGSHVVGWAGHDQYEDCSCRDDTPGIVPIPEDERVDVGTEEWVDTLDERYVDWHHVATATLASYRAVYAGSELTGYVVTLTNVEAV